ncbi:MAG: bifunctional adenosylcobinamide kinase/adenosylcobinamide-phosphate guanylyltransferase [Christensenellaceae bacterium]|nr:bifunctional adenosylcobinamide kinase/adenosylcobinamide-phosphate guanylyltransferase [Christensenellaceae bacterium]
MILITGGAYQGKLDYAMKEYQLGKQDIGDLAVENPQKKRCFIHVEQFVLNCMRSGKSAAEELAPFLDEQTVLICDDISCGVVPLDKEVRAWREATGRTVNALAAQADRVVRIFCGLPMVLK